MQQARDDATAEHSHKVRQDITEIPGSQGRAERARRIKRAPCENTTREDTPGKRKADGNPGEVARPLVDGSLINNAHQEERQHRFQ